MPSLLDLRHRIEYGLLRLLSTLLRILPLDLVVAFCAWGWRIIGPRSRRHTRVLVLKNLEQAFPDMTAKERESIAHALWENMGRVIAETMLLDRPQGPRSDRNCRQG